MMIRHCLLISFLLIITPGLLYSQEKDAGLWMGVGIEKDINKKISLQLEEELRLNENISDVKSFYTDLGIRYKIFKSVKVGVNYRFIKRNSAEGFYNSGNRFYSNIAVKQKLDRFTFGFRTRYQVEYEKANTSENSLIPDKYNRNKFSLSYNIKNSKLNPFVEYELYIPLNYNSELLIDKERYTAGIKCKVNKKSSLKLYYRIQKEKNITNPLNSYIVGVNYSYSL
jgi:hypothetical protein